MKKILVVLLAFVVLLTACNNASTTGEMSYESEKGTINYKSDPKIYADYYVGQLLYLNANLIGANMNYPAHEWKSVADERQVKNVVDDLEQIAALKPDLIITINPDLYEQYSAIAPTVLYSYGEDNPEQTVVEIGKIIGKESEANTWVKEFNTKVEDLKKEIDNPNKTVGIVDSWGGSTYMYGHNYGRGGFLIYDKLGLKGTVQAEEEYIRKKESYLTVDGENLINYAGDTTFIVTNAEKGEDTIKALPTYNSLTSVKNNNVYEISSDQFWYDDPYSLDAQIPVLKEIFSSKDL